MRVALCLILLALCGALIIVDPKHFGLLTVSSAALTLWLGSIKNFLLPIVLVLIGMTRSRFVLLLDFLWGSWVTVTSAAAILSLPWLYPGMTQTTFIAAVMVLGLATALFSIMQLTRPKHKRKKH